MYLHEVEHVQIDMDNLLLVDTHDHHEEDILDMPQRWWMMSSMVAVMTTTKS